MPCLHMLVLLNALMLSVSPSLTRTSSQGQQNSVNAVYNPNKDSSLVLLQMLFRHGDRSPIHVFSWDAHRSAWPQGTGQLTQLGMKQAYQYGGILRERYASFLPQKYNQFEVYVESTDYDRTLMTAQCLLVGLFPANLSNWSFSKWQPIPIHTQPNEMDHLFGHAPCPKLDELTMQYESSSQFMEFASKYQPLNDQLTKYTGSKVDRIIAHQISDTMYCEAQHNMSRPDWLTDDIFIQLMNLRNDTYANKLQTPKIAQLSGGPVLAEVTRNMERRANESSSKEKLYLFSAHDGTVLSLGRVLGIFNNLQPPYLTSISIELHQQGNDFFVKTLFDNHTADSPYTQTIKGCAEMCPLSQFRDLLKDRMMSAAERKKTCVDNSPFKFGEQNVVSTMAGVIFVLAVAVAVLAYKLKRAKFRRKDLTSVQYRQLLQENVDNDEEDDRIDGS